MHWDYLKWTYGKGIVRRNVENLFSSDSEKSVKIFKQPDSAIILNFAWS